MASGYRAPEPQGNLLTQPGQPDKAMTNGAAGVAKIDHVVRLALIHQAHGTAPASSSGVLWRTCVRDVVFVGDTEAAADAPLIADGAAYALLIEIVCGLRSPLMGETEVQAQFKAFLASLDPRVHGSLLRLGQRVLTDVRQIRRRHLQGFGVHSYSGLVSRHVPAGARVVLIGTGALAGKIGSTLGDRHTIDQWGRHQPLAATVQLPAPSEAPPREPRPTRFHLFSSAAPSVLQSADPAVLIVAAPVGAADLARVVGGYPHLLGVIDLRSADERTPLDTGAPTTTLDDLFAETRPDEAASAGRLAAARAEIAALGRAYVTREELRPFGWDDLCA